MTKAERQAIKIRMNAYMAEGVDKTLAKVIAESEFRCGLIEVFEIETETITTFARL